MNSSVFASETSWRARRFRLLGLLPLLFFLARVIEYVIIAKTPEQILWSCHISNLLLAVGLFAAQPWLIRLAAFWQLIGLPLWAMDMALTGLVTTVSVFSHLGGVAVSLYALRQVRAARGSWVPALVFFLVLQQLTRWLTAPTPYSNVNVAHFAYGPWQHWFVNYGSYWLANTALAIVSLWLIEFILLCVFPPATTPKTTPVTKSL